MRKVILFVQIPWPPIKEFARIWRDMPKVVYSKTLASARWNTTIARDVVPGEVEELKLRARGDLVVGGGDLAAAFPLSTKKVLLRLAETRTFGSGVVLLRYERRQEVQHDAAAELGASSKRVSTLRAPTVAGTHARSLVTCCREAPVRAWRS